MDLNMKNNEKPSVVAAQGVIKMSAEIQKMNETKEKCFKNTINLQDVLEKQQKLIQEKQRNITNLEKEISSLKHYLENETNHISSIGKQTDNIEHFYKNIASSITQNNEMLEICEKYKQNLLQTFEEQDIKMKEHLDDMEEVLKNKETEERLLIEMLENQKEKYEENLSQREYKEMLILEKINEAKNEFEVLNKSCAELHEDKEICCNKIVEVNRENADLENELENKQRLQAELMKEMYQEEQEFEHCYEKTLKDIDDISFEFHNIENDIENLQRAIKNQEIYNEDLNKQCKTLEFQNSTVEEENKNLAKLKIEKEAELTKIKSDLHNTLASKLLEFQNTELILVQEEEILTKNLEAEKDVVKVNNKLTQQIEQLEAEISTLKVEHDEVCGNVKTSEEALALLFSKQINVITELEMWKEKAKALELEPAEVLANKKVQLKLLIADIERTKTETQELEKACSQEMDSIKLDYDLKLTQELIQLKKCQNQIEQEMEATEKEYKATLDVHIVQEETLKSTENECQLLQAKIKNLDNLDNLQNILASFATIDKHMDSDSYATPVRIPQSQIFLSPLTKNKRERALDEYSGSSAEGISYNPSELSDLRRLQMRRRESRKQKKMLQARQLNPPK